MPVPRSLIILPILALAACSGGGSGIPGERDDHAPFAQIAPDAVVRLIGTEPFWGGQLEGGTLRYTTPDNPDGTAIAVSRFAGRGGLSVSGTLDGVALLLAITPGACSDAMSDRRYPFVATLQIGTQTREGCAWSDAHPFEERKAP